MSNSLEQLKASGTVRSNSTSFPAFPLCCTPPNPSSDDSAAFW